MDNKSSVTLYCVHAELYCRANRAASASCLAFLIISNLPLTNMKRNSRSSTPISSTLPPPHTIFSTFTSASTSPSPSFSAAITHAPGDNAVCKQGSTVGNAQPLWGKLTTCSLFSSGITTSRFALWRNCTVPSRSTSTNMVLFLTAWIESTASSTTTSSSLFRRVLCCHTLFFSPRPL